MSDQKGKKQLRGRSPRLQSQESKKRAICDGYPVFCFRFLTHNKKFNLDALDAVQSKHLVERLKELSDTAWSEIFSGTGKIAGLETIPYSQLRFHIPNDSIDYCSERMYIRNKKVAVFRFDQQKRRIIGLKQEGCSIFHVLGFDVNYNAYDHGG